METIRVRTKGGGTKREEKVQRGKKERVHLGGGDLQSLEKRTVHYEFQDTREYKCNRKEKESRILGKGSLLCNLRGPIPLFLTEPGMNLIRGRGAK